MFAVLVAAGLLAAQPAAAWSLRKQPSPSSNDAFAARIFSLLNIERKRYGLPPFQRADCATTFAERWSSEMAASEHMRHQSVRTMLQQCRARRAAENIAYGNVSAEDLMKRWMASRPHRANILDPKLRWVGVGAARGADGHWYAVQDFLGF